MKSSLASYTSVDCLVPLVSGYYSYENCSICVELRKISLKLSLSLASSVKRLFLLCSVLLLLFVVNDAIINPSNFENTVIYNMSSVVVAEPDRCRACFFTRSCSRDKRYSHKRCHLLFKRKNLFI